MYRYHDRFGLESKTSASKIYWYKTIAQHTAQNFETPNCRKIADGNPNNSANTDIYAYSETTMGWPTVGYGMTEN